jgi:hypothetical protein
MNNLHIFILVLVFALAYCDKLEWQQLPNKGDIPIGKAGSTLTFLDNKLIVFGGVQECTNLTVGPNNTFTCLFNQFFNDVYIYDLSEESWFKPCIEGDKPDPRAFHRSVGHIESNTMYMYGGTDYQPNALPIFYGDFWKFDVDTLTWTLIGDTNPPGIRVDQGFTIKNDRIFLGFGVSDFTGTPEQNTKNDLWRYNINTGIWTLLIANDPFDPNIPPVRYHPRFDFNEDHNIIMLYGGDVHPFNQRPRYDTWKYSLEDNDWTIIDNNSMIPLFTGVSATFGDIFLVATGEMRYGTQVRCIDPRTGDNNPINDNYIIQFTIKDSTYHHIYPRTNILPTMQAAYNRPKNSNTLYVWGGFNNFCVSRDEPLLDHISVTRYFNMIWKIELPSRLY